MEPRLTNDEQKMRDTMLRHEFPFDEQAWKAMQALLPQNEQQPVPGPAFAQSGNRLKKGKWMLLLLLFLGAVAWWKRTPGGIQPVDDDNLHNTSARFNPSPNPSPEGEGGYPSLRAMTPGSEPSNLQPKAGFLPSSKNKPDATSTGFPPQNKPDSREQAPLPSGGGVGGGAMPNDDQPSRPPTNLNSREQAPLPSGGGVGGGATPNEDQPSPPQNKPDAREQAPLPPGGGVGGGADLLETLPLLPLPLPPVADSLIRPVQEQRRPPSRWQRAWVLGLSANTVDHAPLRVRPAPHIGQLLRYRIDPRTSFQGEITLKMVPGYGLLAEFMDIVPPGSNQVVINVENILFFEMPLAVHHQYAPGKAWLLGLKPAWNIPLLDSGSYASSNFGAPRRNYGPRDGIRIFDLGLVLGWEWRYHPRWALDVRYNQGLFDLTMDSFYQSRDYHLNSDLQISLRHFIIRNKKIRSHEPKPLFPAPAGR